MHKNIKRCKTYRSYLDQINKKNRWGNTRKLMALLVGRLGKKIYWHNPIYCALFKLSIRENLCIQIPGKFVTHLMCTDNNILHTFFFLSHRSTWALTSLLEWCPWNPWLSWWKREIIPSEPGLNWLVSCFFWHKSLSKIANCS